MTVAVMFEAIPRADGRSAYLDAAAALHSHLATFDGFISIERFESLIQPGKLLSLSFWRDEAAVEHWRNFERHRSVQFAARTAILADYRLRVARVLRDYGLHERDQAPRDSQQALEGEREEP